MAGQGSGGRAGVWHGGAERSSSLPQVSLKIEEAAVEHALQDMALVGSILAQGLR